MEPEGVLDTLGVGDARHQEPHMGSWLKYEGWPWPQPCNIEGRRSGVRQAVLGGNVCQDLR